MMNTKKWNWDFPAIVGRALSALGGALTVFLFMKSRKY